MTAPRGTETGTGSGATGSPEARWGTPPPAPREVTGDGWSPRPASPQTDPPPGPPVGRSALEEAAHRLTQQAGVGTDTTASPGTGAGAPADAAGSGGPTASSGPTGPTSPASAPDAPDAPDRTSERTPDRTGDRTGEATTVLPGGPAAGAVRRPAPARPVPPRPGAPRSDVRPAAARPGVARTRRARLALRRIDPWSVFVFSLIASLFVGVALVVAVAVLYSVLGSLGVTQSLNQLFAEVTGGSASGDPLLTGSRIVGGAAVLAAVNVVFLTLLATLASLLYNLCASFTGGIELTLGERD